MDHTTKESKLAELKALKKELIALAKTGDKAAVAAKYAERKTKLAEFNAAKSVQTRGTKCA